MQGNGLKDGSQLVVSVRTLAKDVQAKINFGEGWDANFAHQLLRLGFLRQRLLRYAMLHLAELPFDFSDLVGFYFGWKCAAPFRKRLFPFHTGQLIAAEFGVHIAEVGVNRRIMAFALDRLAKSGLGIWQFVLLEVNPAETIEVRTVERLLLQR